MKKTEIKMLVATDFNNICKQSKLVSQFTNTLQDKNGNDTLCYRMKCKELEMQIHLKNSICVCK